MKELLIPNFMSVLLAMEEEVLKETNLFIKLSVIQIFDEIHSHTFWLKEQGKMSHTIA